MPNGWTDGTLSKRVAQGVKISEDVWTAAGARDTQERERLMIQQRPAYIPFIAATHFRKTFSSSFLFLFEL